MAGGIMLASLPAEAVDEIVWRCGDEAFSPLVVLPITGPPGQVPPF